MEVRRMKMIKRWKRIEEGMGVVFVSIHRGHEFNNRFGIFNHMSVTIDDCLAFEWHKSFLPLLLTQYVTKP
jgi:hypothetical protein